MRTNDPLARPWLSRARRGSRLGLVVTTTAPALAAGLAAIGLGVATAPTAHAAA